MDSVCLSHGVITAEDHVSEYVCLIPIHCVYNAIDDYVFYIQKLT